MRIAVCVKQVPDTTEISIDPATGTLIRDGVPSIVNTYDTYALEAAARIKDEKPDTYIAVISMGPENAENALRECLATAADQAYLLCGREFAGSDTAATSYILASAVRTIEEREGEPFDAIFCGKQAIDGDTAQVGPEVAEHLGLPQVTYAAEVYLDANRLVALREGQYGDERIAVSMPCLVTFTKPSYIPRMPTLSRKLKARKAEITRLSPDDITELDREAIGLAGSPTRVVRSVPATGKREGVILGGDSEEGAAGELAKILSREGFI